MENIVLSVNDSLFYVPTDKVGVVSIDNSNRNGCLIGCFIPENKIYINKSLELGDHIEIKLVSLNSIDIPIDFVMPDKLKKKKVEPETDLNSLEGKKGFEIEVGGQIFSIPFLPDNVQSIVFTLSDNKVGIRVGGMTSDFYFVEYYNAEMILNEIVTVSVKLLNQNSIPKSIHKYKNWPHRN